MPRRPIIRIDEDKCTGCGACITSCAEGALAIVDGKARIIADSLCDGLGACLGACPEGALTIEEREADPFDEQAVQAAHAAPTLPCGCPGSQVSQLAPQKHNVPGAAASALGHWPVKLRLIPQDAPFLHRASLLILADCAAAASPALHRQFLPGRAVALACPKFEDRLPHVAKLTHIFQHHAVRDVTVLEMEVPCCAGLSSLVSQALAQSGADISARRVILGRDGNILREEPLKPAEPGF